MAALQAERGYGLSCGRLGRGTRVSVFHVKLTESALRAFESYQACKVRGGGARHGPGTRPLAGARLWSGGLGGGCGLGGGSAPCGAGFDFRARSDFGAGSRLEGRGVGVGCVLLLHLRLGGVPGFPMRAALGWG